MRICLKNLSVLFYYPLLFPNFMQSFRKIVVTVTEINSLRMHILADKGDITEPFAFAGSIKTSTLQRTVVFTITGSMGPECLQFHKSLAEKLALKSGDRHTDVMNYIRCKLNLMCVRSSLLCWRGSKNPQRSGRVWG